MICKMSSVRAMWHARFEMGFGSVEQHWRSRSRTMFFPCEMHEDKLTLVASFERKQGLLAQLFPAMVDFKAK